MSVLIELADAIVDSLNGGQFSRSFQAQRCYRPSFTLEELQTLQVSVVPKALTVSAAARTSSYFDAAIDIGVQQKLDQKPDEEADELLGLVQEVVDHLRLKRLEGLPDAAWVSIENEPVFAPEHLDQQRTFTSVVTVTYRLRR